MTAFDIAAIRLHSQQLIDPGFKSVKSLVSHFGAIQAQDYPMSKWAIGCRLPGSTDDVIEKAIDDGEIIRTHVLRPTWHLAAAEDIGWMLELTSGNILRQFNSMNKKIGLDEKIFAKSTDIIVKSLTGNQHLTRDELVEILNHHGIKTNEYRSLHILAHAELHGVICSGKRKGRHHSYALMDERIKKPKILDREEALAELGKRYFTSHGPATQKDFHWWSGLSVSDSRLAIELNKKYLTETEYEGQTYYWKDSGAQEMTGHVLLLPAFDEYLIAYKDRTAAIHIDHMPKAFTVNGIFKPLIVVNGQVVGIWKRTCKKDTVIIEPTFFQKVSKATEKEVGTAAESFGRFLGMKVGLVRG
jgi:hypothetical protein